MLEEFYQMTVAHDYVLKGGIDYARKMLMSAFGPDAARHVLDRLMKALATDAATFDALQKADPQQLAKFIHSEHPQTIALILSHLNPTQAAGLLTSLPPEMRADVALRMASLDQISPEIIAKIATIIGQKLKALGEFSRESYGGVRAVSEMFNRLDSTSSKEILDKIEQQDANLAETIRHLMFVFEDLLLVGPGRHQGGPGARGSQDADGGAQGHQRGAQEALPGMHVAARLGDAARRHGSARPDQDQGSRSRRSSRSSPSSASSRPKAWSA